MPNLFLVMLGGAVGAGGRHLLGRATLAWWGPGYPWGTLAVNVLGGFAMGVLVGNLSRLDGSGETWRLLLGTGVLGGFTTFSAFSLDVVLMMERGDWMMAFGYILISVLGALAALMAGLALMRAAA
ncbi:fluoride efflux transporter CrcB [Sphingomonas sp. IC-56]|uniref:fluoride efflux transporter CrcB n=1 Tax=Sphingomonas sp. IC-56 TaxID=2898529 RepID=UPI001E5218F5|nr:fluoride efflux transporter CrcB [Sphingomonas sp. IC-56]MCD2324068.1 fluoride efflux transporter CrcB [Sphingomonas sp. IC-56]